MASAIPLSQAPASQVRPPPYPQTPVLGMGFAVACLVANVFIPGLGTLIAGISTGRPLIGRAAGQFFLWILIVGWVWGVVTGVQLISNASWADKTGAPREG
jgi:hypothetical protein